MSSRIILLILLVTGACSMSARDSYWVFFTDKGPDSGIALEKPGAFLSDAALKRRSVSGISVDFTDLPVYENYIEYLEDLPGIQINTVSRWMNGVSVQVDRETDLAELATLEFVRHIQPVGRYYTDGDSDLELQSAAKSDSYPLEEVSAYGVTRNQLEMTSTDYLHKVGYRGEGMIIAILDAGWRGVDVLDIFSEMWVSDRIVDQWNFHRNNDSVFEFSSHGTSVLSIAGSNVPGTYIGAAPEADFCLYLTEVTEFERVIEEDYWLAAAERADQMGVHVINTSLGYTNFDSVDAHLNHTYADMDGNTTVISRAADMAAAKGILVVVSAGNQGGNPWYYISAPADGDSVLAVGAVDQKGIVAGFSGHGPSADGDVKPNVTTVGVGTWRISSGGDVAPGNGTSFSAPLIAGAAACLWQAWPERNNMEIFRAIEKSSDRYTDPDTESGFGIPDFASAFHSLRDVQDPSTEGQAFFAPNPAERTGGVYCIAFPEKIANIHVSDLAGRTVFEEDFVLSDAASHYLPVSGIQNWPAGMYMVTLQSGAIIRNLKVVKK